MSTTLPTLTFSSKYTEGIIPHKEDLIVIVGATVGFKVEKVVIDLGSSINIIYRRMKMSSEKLWQCLGSLIGFSG